MRIGIPRALFFYHLYPQWKVFFQELGWEPVSSPETTKAIATEGSSRAVNEACYPVKIYYGHIAYLARQSVDWLFVPRLVSIERKTYICPKFMGLPDMIRSQIEDLPPLMDICIDVCRSEKGLKRELHKWARMMGDSPRKWEKAWGVSREALSEWRGIACRGYTASEALKVWEGGAELRAQGYDLRIGVIGHCYSINDQQVNLGMIDRLRAMGAESVTPEMLDQGEVAAASSKLPKRMFWTAGKSAAGAALMMDLDESIDGIIYLSCFGCGPDSITARTLEYRVKNKPFMQLTVDEHSGEAGVVTRLEAFCDMLRRRRQLESDLSPHGQCLHSSASSI
ncbi:MAG: acyl-CoA dehydratase activase-related protein [Candidatus Saccharibacteria bacterium]